jgi:hypothetical protein
MKQLEGFHQGGDNWVAKLRKGLYGLKQSGRLWYEKLGKVLDGLGFKRLQSDASIYIYTSDAGTRLVIPVFVDDLTIISPSKVDIDHVKAQLRDVFKLRDLGPISFLLGVQIDYDRNARTIALSQKQYILDILERAGMSDCHPVTRPMDSGSKLSKEMEPQTKEEADEMKSVPYIHLVGAVNYLAISTRPDISFTISQLARFNTNPGIQHWCTLKHLLRYLKGSADLRLVYSPTQDPELFTTYVDADHGGDVDTGKSTTGYLVKMGTGAVAWSSKKQSIVALSTTEAEYVAAVSAGMEIVWTRNLFGELGVDFSSSSTLHIDNQSAIQVAKNPEHHGRMKHLDLRYFWLRDAVSKGIIGVKYIATKLQVADILTKALPRITMEEHRAQMGLC